MSKPKTYVAVVLDKSGSMESVRQQAINDYNEQIQQIRENSKEQDIKTCLVTFNGSVFEHSWLAEVDELEEATLESYVPNGGTAMRDAIGYTIKRLQLVDDINDENVAFLLIIISDGYENSSQRYSAAELRTLISGCQETKRWTFTYMGCSEGYLKQVSEETSIPLDNMAVWSTSDAESASFGLQTKMCRSSGYFQKRAMGEIDVNNFYSDVSGACANYDPAAQIGDPNFIPSHQIGDPNFIQSHQIGDPNFIQSHVTVNTTITNPADMVVNKTPFNQVDRTPKKISKNAFGGGSEVKWTS